MNDLLSGLVPQRLRQHDQRVLRASRGNLRIGPHQPHCAPGLHKGQPQVAGLAFLLRAGAHPAVEERHRDVEHIGDPLQPAGGDPIHALFVLLHLLERQPDPIPQIRLGKTALQPQGADFAPDLGVFRPGAALSGRPIPRIDQIPPSRDAIISRAPGPGIASESMCIPYDFP